MFATIKGLIPEPRQADQPRHYIGRHRNTQVLEAPPGQHIPAQDPQAGTDEPVPDGTPASDDAGSLAACRPRPQA